MDGHYDITTEFGGALLQMVACHAWHLGFSQGMRDERLSAPFGMR